MPYLIGLVLALGVSAFATFVGFDRDPAFYPTVMVIIASYYVLFAVMGGSTRALGIESLIMAGFVGIAVAGFKRNLWIVAAALAAHAVLDFNHGRLVDNPGVPAWWPAFCLAYDLAAAGYLAWRLSRAIVAASMPPGESA